jgi:ribosome-associated protein
MTPGNDKLDKETEEHHPSKSQLKRESDALQKLGEELISLKSAELDSMNLPDVLDEAIRAARKIQSRGGLKRQRQYIGKIMRQIDSNAIKIQLGTIKHKHDTNTANFKRIEKWRDRLLENDKTALTEIIEQYPDIDRQHMNQLIRLANQEKQKDKAPAAARKLFKYLRDLED